MSDAIKVRLQSDFVDLNRPSKIPEPNVWSTTFKIKKSMERGTWTLVRLGLGDGANNFNTYFAGREAILEGITVDFLPEDEQTETGTTRWRAERARPGGSGRAEGAGPR
ncbi:MAG: hypothetical protein ACRD3V_20155, partial [Vicinamibacteria bacterium]